jgi:Leucine-rich repeat (LRR) protein
LKTLDVAGNQISKIENISHLKKLEEFWLHIFHNRPIAIKSQISETSIPS